MKTVGGFSADYDDEPEYPICDQCGYERHKYMMHEQEDGSIICEHCLEYNRELEEENEY